ncbi:MAG: hypothetical protein CMR00_04855 [[Chlorobium] sp. 445]|nr:MAG: hypothetical protein CMR00_04855 [[Chlorobium] sp. 445]
MEVVYWVLCLVLVLLGFAGIVLPGVPSAPLVFLGLLGAAWIDDFERVGWLPLLLIGILGMLTFVADFLSTALGAKRVGASTWAIVGATVGTMVGLLFGFIGILLAPFIGAVLGEYLAKRDMLQSAKAGLGTWVGMVIGASAKIALLFMMVGIFAVAYFF